MINIYERIIKNLNVVLFYKETTILLSIDQNFYNSVNKLINICNYIENNEKIEVKQTPDYILLMETITEKKFIIEEFKNLDLSEANTELENMKSIVKNVIKKDIEEISLILKKELMDKLDKKESDEVATSNIQENQTIHNEENRFNSNHNSSTFEQRNASSINQIANNMIEQQAQSLIFMDMNNGKLYRYTTKPKIIPIIKKILLILMILLAIILVTSSIITFTFGGGITNYPAYVFSNPFLADDGFLDLSSNNIFGNMFVYIGIALMGFSLTSSFKNSKTNENVQYSMRISTYIMPAIFFLLISTLFTINGSVVILWQRIFNASTIPNISFTPNPPNGPEYDSVNESAYPGLLTIFILSIIGYVIVALTLLLLVISHNYKPKEDFEKLNTIRQNYVNDIKSGKIDMSDPSMFPPPRRFPF